MYPRFIVLVTIVTIFLVGFDCLKCDNSVPKSTLEKLKRKLLCDYDKEIRPSNGANATNIQMRFVISKYNYEERLSTIVVSSINKMSWFDNSFKWDPKEYDNITRFDESFVNIWNPDLFLFSSHSESPGSCWSNNCFIRSDSKVSCFLICNNRAQCFSDYENWPQDVQKCYLNFGSLSLHGNKINFEVGKVKINTKRVLDSHQWKLLSATTIIDEGNNNETYTFPTVTYKLLISQHTTLPIAVIFVPLLVLAIINLFLLWITPGCNQRTILVMLILLSHFHLMKQLFDVVPHNGDTIPTVFDCFQSSIFITLILLIETFVVKLIIESTDKPAWWMESITVFAKSTKISEFIFSSNHHQKQDSVELIKEDAVKKSNDYYKRLTFTKIIDRSLFLILILIYIDKIYKSFFTDIPDKYEYLDVDE